MVGGRFQSGRPPIAVHGHCPYFVFMQATNAKQNSGGLVGSTNAPGAAQAAARIDQCAANGGGKTAFGPPNGNGNSKSRALVEALGKSRIYQDYERAFGQMTGLPVALCSAESWQLPHHGRRNENPFCEMMSQKSRACAACLQTDDKLSRLAAQQPGTVTCAMGMSDTAVPVRLGERLLCFLKTGQVFRRRPTQTQFDRVANLVSEWGVETDREELKAAFFRTRVLSKPHHESVVKLLAIFAQHLSILSNQVIVRQENAEPPLITRARQYIHDHHTEDLRLNDVAKAVNTSRFNFCKIFKKITGFTFSHYLSRVRIEKAKNLLLNPNLRVSEIAYEVGFQSLTHFNRVFKNLFGQSPTEYRAHLLGHH